MQTNVTLQNLMQFHWIWLLLPILLLLVAIILHFYAKKKWPLAKNKKGPTIKKPLPPTSFQIKHRYQSRLNQLSKQVEEKTISNREAYQTLSTLVRMFVYEMTSIQVQNYTLKEISLLDYEPLTALVTEYYQPEFTENEKGDITSSLEKTKGVISAWK